MLVSVVSLSLVVAVTFFFAYRVENTARHIRWQDEAIKTWMSVPFIAHTHHIREELLFQAIRVKPNPRDHRPIRDIARAEKLPAAELVRELQHAIVNADTAPKAP
jgi:hypothetical protein